MSLFMRVYLKNEGLYDALEEVPEDLYKTWDESVSNDPRLRILTGLTWVGLALVTASVYFVPWLMLSSFPPMTMGRFLVIAVPWGLFFAYLLNIHVFRQMIRQTIEIKHARRLGITWRAAN